jgi:hypothetical protein
MADTKQNYTIEGRAGAIIKDVQREWMWNLSIPNITNMVDTNDLDLTKDLVEEMTIRARSVSMPSRGVETIESVFMSQKQFFPGKPTFGNTVSVQFEESENQNVAKILYSWQQNIMDIRSGHSNRLGKRPANQPGSYVTDMILNMVSFNGTASDKIILFKNVFPENVGDVALSYDGAGSVKFDVTFRFDFWYLMRLGEPIITA